MKICILAFVSDIPSFNFPILQNEHPIFLNTLYNEKLELKRSPLMIAINSLDEEKSEAASLLNEIVEKIESKFEKKRENFIESPYLKLFSNKIQSKYSSNSQSTSFSSSSSSVSKNSSINSTHLLDNLIINFFSVNIRRLIVATDKYLSIQGIQSKYQKSSKTLTNTMIKKTKSIKKRQLKSLSIIQDLYQSLDQTLPLKNDEENEEDNTTNFLYSNNNITKNNIKNENSIKILTNSLAVKTNYSDKRKRRNANEVRTKDQEKISNSTSFLTSSTSISSDIMSSISNLPNSLNENVISNNNNNSNIWSFLLKNYTDGPYKDDEFVNSSL